MEQEKKKKPLSVLLIFLISICMIVAGVILLNKNNSKPNTNSSTNKEINSSTNKQSSISEKVSCTIGGYKMYLGETSFEDVFANSTFKGELQERHDLYTNEITGYEGTISDGYSELLIKADKNKKITSISTLKGNQVSSGLVFDSNNSDFSLYGDIKIGMKLEDVIKVYGNYSYTGDSYINDDKDLCKTYYWSQKYSKSYTEVGSFESLHIYVLAESNTIINIAVIN